MSIDADKLAELRREFKQKKAELYVLRAQINSISLQKEEAYRQLRVCREGIKSRLKQVKDFTNERNQLTKRVKEFKKGRDALNLAVTEKSVRKKEADRKKKDIQEKLQVKGDPIRIRIVIENLEKKLETEVIPFSQEQKIRKEIKELKARYNKITELGSVWKEINTAAAEFTNTRREAERLHRKVQETARTSQQKHEQISALYKQVNELKEKESQLAEKYLAFKIRYEPLKKKLEELSSRVRELGKLFDDEEKKSFKRQVTEKTAYIKEKLRKKEKLNTEDILAFQALDE